MEELAERFAGIQRDADVFESSDLSLYLRSFRALLSRLLDSNDVQQTHQDLLVFWHKIMAEVSSLRRDQSLGASASALSIVLISIASDLNTVVRNLGLA